MKQVVTSERVPIKLWLDDIEEGAMEQTKNLANLPFAFKHIPIMPDSHQGYGMPIGAVLATKGAVIPNAVGVDIGCGMCAVKTSLEHIDTPDLQKVMDEVAKLVPVGFTWHDNSQVDTGFMPDHPGSDHKTVSEHWDKATFQLGTLGGGNHFVEVQQGDDGRVWIMIHSGSRQLGFKTAAYHNKVAVKLNETYYSSVPKEHGLAFIPIDTQEYYEYWHEMNYCVEFAKANRFLMLERVREAFSHILSIEFEGEIINESHNYAAWEHHFKNNVIVHRKGATRANSGELGIIPGSQGTHSYIVKGKGEEQSFKSCSHGAGRKMGRKQAKRELDLKQEQKIMGDVLHHIETTDQLDEAPGAYKDIDTVINNQTDLCEVVVKLRPLAVLKG